METPIKKPCDNGGVLGKTQEKGGNMGKKWLIYLFVLATTGAGTIQISSHAKLQSIRWVPCGRGGKCMIPDPRMTNSNQLVAGRITKKGTRGGIRAGMTDSLENLG